MSESCLFGKEVKILNMEFNGDILKAATPKVLTHETGGVNLTKDYSPTEDEPYMNPRQLEYFRSKLMGWRDHLLRESNDTLKDLTVQRDKEKDFLDQGAMESGTTIKLKNRERYRVLIFQIADALERINKGTYGYCEETGEEIGIKRLDALPIATLSLEAQKWHERREKERRRNMR